MAWARVQRHGWGDGLIGHLFGGEAEGPCLEVGSGVGGWC